MTTLYKPVLIESAEQAEALPDDAIVIGVETGERYTKTYDGEWWGATEMAGPLSHDMKYEKIVALVPIKAKKERTWISSNLAGPVHVGFGAAFDTPHARLVTPWEEA